MFDFVRNLSKSEAEKRQEALSAYLDEALSAGRRQAFERQLADDANLQQELETQRLIRQQMRALPRRSVPRSFTLDPAVYGAPHKEPLVQAYPVLRAATALTAFFFVMALAFSLVNKGAFSQSAAMAPMAAEAPMEESEIAAAPQMAADEVVTEEVAADTAVEESAASGAMPAAEAPVEMTRVVTEEAAEEAPTDGAAGLAQAVPTPAPLATQGLPGMLPTATPSELPRPEATQLADAAARAAATESYAAETANAVPLQATAVAEPAPAPVPGPVSLWLWLPVVLGGLLLILLFVTFAARRRL